MKWIKTFLIITVSAPLHSADFGFSLYNKSGYAENIFANYHQLPDAYTRTAGFVNADWIGAQNGVRLYYEGTWTAFQNYRDRGSLRHAFGLKSYRDLSERGDNVRGGIEWRRMSYGSGYEWYDAGEFSGFGNVKWVLGPQLYFYSGGSIRRKSYVHLPPFSHWSGSIYGRASRFFNSGTTAMLEVDLLFKRYDPDASQRPVDELPEMVTLGTGTGQQAVVRLRLAQAVTPVTGISLELSRRQVLQSSVRYIGTGSGIYYSDEELFDDVFGYESNSLSLEIKQRLPWGMQLQLGGAVMEKAYPERLAFDLEGVPYPDGRLRSDNRSSAWISVQRSWSPGAGLPLLKLALDGYLLNNGSNDPYYHYDSSGLSLGLSFDF